MPEWWMEHENFLIELDNTVDQLPGFDTKITEDEYKSVIIKLYGMAMRLAEIADTEEKYETLDDIMTHSVMDWLLDLPRNLAKYGYVDEAVHLGKKWAAITDPENFLGDAVVILAEAGRKEQALELIADLQKNYFYDIWVQIKTGDAYAAIKDLTNAELIYKKAVDAAEKKYDQEGILERLIPMLEKQGRTTEAEEIQARLRARQEAMNRGRYQMKPISSPDKPGRNDPCPCGSGNKYKKCCGK